MDSSARGTYDELKLDPGVPARRKRSSGCKCVSIIMLTSIGSLVALFCGINLVNMYRLKQEPHASLLYKTKSGDIVDPAAVIRPLIDEKQTFDIVATVWLRTNDDSSSGSADVSTLPVEKAIFTGKVFQGLTLKDKGIHTTVNYTVPTEIFKNHDLKDYDLRASFVLIPTSPSFLDNLTNYSSWRNERIPLPPFRSWPDTGSAPTLQDKAIDSFGVSIGLLQFFGIRSRCDLSSTSNITDVSKHTEHDDADDDDGDDEIYTTEQLSKADQSQPSSVLESHPHIISHSFIRAVDMTELYDRKAYNQAHKKLKNNACGLASLPPNYDWKLCDLGMHETIDTRLQLKMGEEGSGNKSKHWAYAPGLSLSKSAWTPKNLVPVPVNREDCTKGGRLNTSESLLPDQEIVDITWEIVYSGRSSIKLMISDAIAPSVDYNITDIEEVPQELQSTLEMMQGLRGNRLHKDRHPRRIFFRATLVIVINLIIKLINIRYWYTCSSTIGISKFATILFAVITLGNYFLNNLTIYDEQFWIPLMATLAFLPWETSPLLMLRVVWRMEFGWNRKEGKDKWTEKGKLKVKRRRRVPMPSVRFAKATHEERASDRLDARTPWIVKVSLFISCCLAYYFFSPTTSLFLIPPLASSTPQIDDHQLRTTLVRSLVSPGLIVGSGLQLWFNHQSRTFAGKYKLSAVLEGINVMLGLLQFSTWVLGYREVREGFSVHDLMNAFVVVVWCYQAAVLPTVRQDDEVE